ncbi:MAG: hypothetical protein LBJ11_11450 [Oscillospiraceae bacterium]|jgi:rRNA maturation endonuclease Nob1|nr:hypothetical protein [Oscillospiraceae bacterium]
MFHLYQSKNEAVALRAIAWLKSQEKLLAAAKWHRLHLTHGKACFLAAVQRLDQKNLAAEIERLESAVHQRGKDDTADWVLVFLRIRAAERMSDKAKAEVMGDPALVQAISREIAENRFEHAFYRLDAAKQLDDQALAQQIFYEVALGDDERAAEAAIGYPAIRGAAKECITDQTILAQVAAEASLAHIRKVACMKAGGHIRDAHCTCTRCGEGHLHGFDSANVCKYCGGVHVYRAHTETNEVEDGYHFESGNSHPWYETTTETIVDENSITYPDGVKEDLSARIF